MIAPIWRYAARKARECVRLKRENDGLHQLLAVANQQAEIAREELIDTEAEVRALRAQLVFIIDLGGSPDEWLLPSHPEGEAGVG